MRAENETLKATLKMQLAWLPIDQADRAIVHQQHFPSVGITLQNSERYWVRDEDGRVYEASWTEDEKRSYWWDWDAESPVDPVEFMPHPLDPRFSTEDDGPDLLSVALEVREACLFVHDDGEIGVSEDVVIPFELFDRLCAAINKAEGRS